MTLPRITYALAIVAAVAGAGCRSSAGSASDGDRPAMPTAAVRGRVSLTELQLKQISLETLSLHPPADVIKATGTVEFDADRMAKLIPPVAGQAQELAVNVGDRVRKGAVLFVLSSRDVAAALAEHTAAQKDVDLAEKTFAMTQDLFEHQAASKMALQQSENELAKVRSRLAQTEENLRVLGLDAGAAEALRPQAKIPVRAPLAGTVIERTVTDG